MGLSTTLATAARSLEVFSAGVQVAGQNIANASTPGYVRESLVLETGFPVRRGQLIFGTGVNATGIRQQLNVFLESRIHSANGDAAAAAAREGILQEIEARLNELGESDLSTRANAFLAAINDLVNQPESDSLRQLAVGQGRQFATDVAALRTGLDELRRTQNGRVESLAAEANRLIGTISELNLQVVQLESGGLSGSQAGALRTQRYDALTRLSEIVPIRFQERENGAVEVFSGSDYLVLGDTVQRLELVPTTDRQLAIQTVQLSGTKAPLPAAGGELRGVIEGRDVLIGGFIDQLDTFVSNVISEFNRVHASGEGLKGFTSVTAETRVADPTAVLSAAGLPVTPRHGSFQLKVTNAQTGLSETTTVAIDLDGIGTDTTLDDLRAALGGVGNVTATVTPQGRLQIQAGAGYEIRFSGDTSGVLAGLGINTFFTGSDSASIGVNSTVVRDPAYFAAGQGGGPSDGRNAVLLAGFLDRPLDALGGVALKDYYAGAVSSLAQASASESAVAKGFAGFRDSLLAQREQFSGVSLDEEAIKLMEFQRAYQAAARIVTTVDELFTTLLNV